MEEFKGPFTFHFGQRRSLSPPPVSSLVSLLLLRSLFLLPFHHPFLALLISFSLFSSFYFRSFSFSLPPPLSLSQFFISFRSLPPYFSRTGSYAITFLSLFVPRLFQHFLWFYCTPRLKPSQREKKRERGQSVALQRSWIELRSVDGNYRRARRAKRVCRG